MASRATSRSPSAIAPRGRGSRPRKLTDSAWLEVERAAKVAKAHGVTLDLWHLGVTVRAIQPRRRQGQQTQQTRGGGNERRVVAPEPRHTPSPRNARKRRSAERMQEFLLRKRSAAAVKAAASTPSESPGQERQSEDARPPEEPAVAAADQSEDARPPEEPAVAAADPAQPEATCSRGTPGCVALGAHMTRSWALVAAGAPATAAEEPMELDMGAASPTGKRAHRSPKPAAGTAPKPTKKTRGTVLLGKSLADVHP